MSIPNKTKREIKPTHPGEMLREDFMPDYALTPAMLTAALGVSRGTINELLHEKRSLTPAMALRLSKLFGNTPRFWLNAQQAIDLWNQEKNIKAALSRIQPLTPAHSIAA